MGLQEEYVSFDDERDLARFLEKEGSALYIEGIYSLNIEVVKKQSDEPTS